MLTRNCFTLFEDKHVVLTDDDVLLVDGFNVQSIANKRVRRLINSSLDADNINNAFVAHYRTENEIWICLPDVGATEPNLAAIWNYRDDTWTTRTLPGVTHAASGVINEGVVDNTWDAQTESWDAYSGGAWNDQGFSLRGDEMILAGRANTKLYQVDQGTGFDGMPVAATLTKERMA